MGMSIGLITLFRKKFNDQGEFTKKVSGDIYTVYLIHAPVLISVSLLFAGILIFALLKFVIVFPIVVLLCILISHYILRKIPGAKRILG
jgi:surface polysaccharide O-acyltransferase-like enzyme